ncbi:MAG: radical SAM protein [Candidatus Omnitrophica bacterium CG11_big_fil_rev_8_21_14_0_20_45_26]|uniref:Radical SAM protein n=1 Tax=Candidatus Abzuiibacterium crystallinum TaxID=1974748 RepID=A0A2H0LRD7_9BACT|nr:MAG: radical SAM protein [Candidatus Omnitrophica bacterium CG11_big_fil_rev_8_21_14_0_20_45_26]PIW65660.1 MAG: radical SAM protein [Candidatus Omnitrophica bacterium CG12_big_fil_rev_8_21_14_0_65_45_16]
MNQFARKINDLNYSLRKNSIEILQVNLGKLCNLTCSHCHVESGPGKTRENMGRETADAVIRSFDRFPIHTVDLTGGAPELNPHFKWIVREARQRHLHVIDRCNLTIFFEPGYQDLPDFLAENEVEIVASLPCYSRENVDGQRGKGTFDRSIEALQWLNRLGYGQAGSNLKLNLVYNPVGAHLPPLQEKLEADYKHFLSQDFGIVFDHLYTITNMPMTRYERFLKATKAFDCYTDLLITHFNPATLDDLMCRRTISVSWDGFLYDCDFNQMLDLKIGGGEPLTIQNAQPADMENREIVTAHHCFGCTAGAGSSCRGALTSVSELK